MVGVGLKLVRNTSFHKTCIDKSYNKHFTCVKNVRSHFSISFLTFLIFLINFVKLIFPGQIFSGNKSFFSSFLIRKAAKKDLLMAWQLKGGG